MRTWIPILAMVLVSPFSAGADKPATTGPEKNPFSPWYLRHAERWWHFDALVGVEVEPDYVGSDDSELEPAASLRALFKDRFGNRYTVAPGEVGAAFYFGDRWALTVDFELEDGRETENEDLRGLPEGRETLEGELALFRRWGDGYAYAVYQPDLLSRGKGIVTFIGYGYDHLTAGERWLLSPRVDISWGDREHMQTEFGLSTSEAAIIGQRPYTPGGGLKSTTMGFMAQRFFGRRWSWLTSLEIELYHDRAADSPLLSELGSEVTFEATIGAFYTF